MKIETKFDIGDVVWEVRESVSHKWVVEDPLTIGQILVDMADSLGVEDKEPFENYSPQKWYQESYMCVETGIGTGRLYRVENLFSSVAEAVAECGLRNRAAEEASE